MCAIKIEAYCFILRPNMSDPKSFVDDSVTYSELQQIETSCMDCKNEAKPTTPIYTTVDPPKKKENRTASSKNSSTDATPTSTYQNVATKEKMNSESQEFVKTEQPACFAIDTTTTPYDVPIETKKNENSMRPSANSPKEYEESTTNPLVLQSYDTTMTNRQKKKNNLVNTNFCILWIFAICASTSFIVVAILVGIFFSEYNSLKHVADTIKFDVSNNYEEMNKIKGLVNNLSMYISMHEDNKVAESELVSPTLRNETKSTISAIIYAIFSSIGQSASYPAPSCCFILHLYPESYSDFYWIDSGGRAINVFCNMLDCENPTSGWIKIAELDVAHGDESCPTNLTKINRDGYIYCELPIKNKSLCSSIYFNINRTYSYILGSVIGYGDGSLDGFVNNNNISDIYLDGVSITYEIKGVKTHIWSYIARGFCSEENPCSQNLPSFVNTSYSCDTVSNGAVIWNENLCNTTDSRWFLKQLSERTNSDIEMRLCLDENTIDESLGISYFKLYIH